MWPVSDMWCVSHPTPGLWVQGMVNSCVLVMMAETKGQQRTSEGAIHFMVLRTLSKRNNGCDQFLKGWLLTTVVCLCLELEFISLSPAAWDAWRNEVSEGCNQAMVGLKIPSRGQLAGRCREWHVAPVAGWQC